MNTLRRISFALALVALVSVTGCFKTNYYQGSMQPSDAMAIDQEIWHHGLFWGLLELNAPIRLDEVCPSGFQQIHTEVTVLDAVFDWLVTAVGTGIINRVLALAIGRGIPGNIDWWTPQHVYIDCKGGSAFNAVLDGDYVTALAPVQ